MKAGHWRSASVESLGTITTGRTPPTARGEYWGGPVPFITPSDLNGGVITTTNRYISEEGLRYSVALPPGTVLVSCIGYVGKTALTNSPVAATNQQINAVIPNPDVADSWFLLYAFTHAEPRFRDSASVTTLPILNKSRFQACIIPLPRLGEQRAIGYALRSLQEAQDVRRRELKLERKRKAALTEHLFASGTRKEIQQETDRGSLPQHWCFSDLGEFISEGPQNGLYKHGSAYGEGTPIIRINDYDNDGRFVTPDFNRVRLEAAEASKFRVETGDLLINRVNSLSHLGKCALVPELPEPTVFESNMMRFRVDEHRLMPEFVARFLRLDACRERIRNMAKRAVAQSSINQGDVRSLPVPVPPLEEQREIVEVLEACDGKIAALEAEAALHEELFRAMLEELMTGRLSAVGLVEPEAHES